MKIHLLLLEDLQENKIPPKILIQVLENYLETLKQYLITVPIEREIEILIGKDIENAIKPFVNLLDYIVIVKRM